MEEKKQIEKAAQKIRTAAASELKKKRKDKKIMVCELCGHEKSCIKRRESGDLYLCNACTVLASSVKKSPQAVQKAWERFGPGSSLSEESAPVQEAQPAPEPAQVIRVTMDSHFFDVVLHNPADALLELTNCALNAILTYNKERRDGKECDSINQGSTCSPAHSEETIGA